MQEFFTPDSLDELDRRVYDLAIQHIPLAEMAVRLGVPVPQADEKLQRLYSRLGVSDRAALRALSDRPKPPGVVPEDEFVIGASVDPGPSVESTPGPELPRRFTRRRILTAGVVTGVIGASGAAALAFDHRQGTAPGRKGFIPDTGEGRVTAVAGTSFPLTVGPGIGQSFGKKLWSPGQEIIWLHGIFFMSPETSAIEGFQFSNRDGGNFEWAEYAALGEGRFITATNRQSNVGMLVDRENLTTSFSWEPSAYRLLAAFAREHSREISLLFLSESDGSTLRFVKVAPFGVAVQASLIEPKPHPGVLTRLIQEPGGSRIALFDGPRAPAEIRVFDIVTGEQFATHQIAPTGNESAMVLPVQFQQIPGGFLARWRINGTDMAPDGSLRFDWDGTPQSAQQDDMRTTFYAPNGLWTATETRVARNGTDWPSVQVSRGVPFSPDFRLRSAALTYGDVLPPNRWLADGSGFVAAIRGSGPDDYRYAVVPTLGTPIQPFPSPRSINPGAWYEDTWTAGPVPAPFDPDLFAFGRLHIYNRRTGRWFSARITSDSGPDHLDPWSAGEELVFALPHAFHDLRPVPRMLAPRYEQPPFDDSLTFVVEVDPEGLSLRADPAFEAQIISVLHNGDRLSLAESPDPSLGPSESSAHQSGGTLWLYVRTESGLEGWVNSTWLAWA